jgi:hypothetical protein
LRLDSGHRAVVGRRPGALQEDRQCRQLAFDHALLGEAHGKAGSQHEA